MVFNSTRSWGMSCPKCHQGSGTDFAEDHDIECGRCKITYRRSLIWKPAQTGSEAKRENGPPIDPDLIAGLDTKLNGLKLKRTLDEGEEVALFRRVRIQTSIALPAENSRPGPLASDETSTSDNIRPLAHTGTSGCCYQVIERYSVCRCLYYKHPVDHRTNCSGHGTPVHQVAERTVLVGYACETHSNFY
jgi:hypothetical protein